MVHIFGECKLPKSKKKREKYWKKLIHKNLWNYMEKIKKGTAEIQFPDASLTDIRCALILYSIGFIELPAAELSGMNPEGVGCLIAASAPEAIVYMMEFAKVVEIDEKTGDVKLSKKGKDIAEQGSFYIR